MNVTSDTDIKITLLLFFECYHARLCGDGSTQGYAISSEIAQEAARWSTNTLYRYPE
jgi:hypothetical protein